MSRSHRVLIFLRPVLFCQQRPGALVVDLDRTPSTVTASGGVLDAVAPRRRALGSKARIFSLCGAD